MPVALPEHSLPAVAPRGPGGLSRDAWRALLDRLRGAVEHTGVAFDVARRALGVSDAHHRAWLRRAADLEARSPSLTLRDGVLHVGGSDEPEAEYARIAATSDAREAARLIAKLDKIAHDDTRGPAQVAAIKLQLGALAPSLYGTSRVEAQVTADVQAAPADAIDPARLDGMTPEQRAAVIDAARVLSAARDRLRAAMSLPPGRAPEHVADAEAPGSRTWTEPLDLQVAEAEEVDA